MSSEEPDCRRGEGPRDHHRPEHDRSSEELLETREALEDETRILELLNRTGRTLAAELDLEVLVQTVTDAGGWSNSDGPCDKNDKGRTGAVLRASAANDDFTGVLLAHEVGHYLTLEHTNTITNLMGADTNNDGIGEITANSRDLTNNQANQMLGSCWVRSPC